MKQLDEELWHEKLKAWSDSSLTIREPISTTQPEFYELSVKPPSSTTIAFRMELGGLQTEEHNRNEHI